MSILSHSPDEFDVVQLTRYVPEPCRQQGRPLREMPFRQDAWSPGELADLARMFADDAAIADIGEHLDRKLHAVRSKIHELGLRRNSIREWTPLDDTELASRYGIDATASIAGDLGRSCSAIYARAQYLNLTEPNPPEWTAWEDAQLRAGYEEAIDVARIAAIIGRPVSGTASRASKLRLRHPNNPDGWTDEEICRAVELLETGLLYTKVIDILASEGFPRRSKAGFGPKIRAAGYTRGWGRAWLPEEDALLRKAYAHGSSLTPLRTRLGRTRHSIKWRAEHLGLNGTHNHENGFRGGPDWSEADIAYLREHYGSMPNAALAKQLGRSKLAVSTRANVLGLVHGYIRPWSEDELAALEIAYRCNIAIADLALALRRKAMSVSKFATKRDLHFGRRARLDRPPTLGDILALERGGGGETGNRSMKEDTGETRHDQGDRQPGNDLEGDAPVQRDDRRHSERTPAERPSRWRERSRRRRDDRRERLAGYHRRRRLRDR